MLSLPRALQRVGVDGDLIGSLECVPEALVPQASGVAVAPCLADESKVMKDVLER